MLRRNRLVVFLLKFFSESSEKRVLRVLPGDPSRAEVKN